MTSVNAIFAAGLLRERRFATQFYCAKGLLLALQLCTRKQWTAIAYGCDKPPAMMSSMPGWAWTSRRRSLHRFGTPADGFELMGGRRDDLVLAACKTLGLPGRQAKAVELRLCVRLQRLQKHRLCTRSRSAKPNLSFAAFVCKNKPQCAQCAAACKNVHSVQQSAAALAQKAVHSSSIRQ